MATRQALKAEDGPGAEDVEARTRFSPRASEGGTEDGALLVS